MRLTALAAIAACVLAAGCGGEDQAAQAPEPASTALTIELDPGEGASTTTWELRCSPSGGDVPDPAAACSGLAGETDPFRAPPADAVCTEIYGGPARLHVTGTLAAEPVDATFTRADGCQIDRFDSISTLFGLPPAG